MVIVLIVIQIVKIVHPHLIVKFVEEIYSYLKANAMIFVLKVILMIQIKIVFLANLDVQTVQVIYQHVTSAKII